jgi:hypothetical protein
MKAGSSPEISNDIVTIEWKGWCIFIKKLENAGIIFQC